MYSGSTLTRVFQYRDVDWEWNPQSSLGSCAHYPIPPESVVPYDTGRKVSPLHVHRSVRGPSAAVPVLGSVQVLCLRFCRRPWSPNRLVTEKTFRKSARHHPVPVQEPQTGTTSHVNPIHSARKNCAPIPSSHLKVVEDKELVNDTRSTPNLTNVPSSNPGGSFQDTSSVTTRKTSISLTPFFPNHSTSRSITWSRIGELSSINLRQ